MELALNRSTTLVSFVALEKSIKAEHVVPGADVSLGQVLNLTVGAKERYGSLGVRDSEKSTCSSVSEHAPTKAATHWTSPSISH